MTTLHLHATGARRRLDPRWWTFVFVAGVLATWELSSTFGVVDPLFFSRPTDVATATWDMSRAGTIPRDLAISGGRLGRGFAIGALAGGLVGIAFGWAPRVRAVFDPVVAVIHPLPKISLFPLFLLILGLGEAPKVAVIAVSTFFPMVINTTLGVREIPPELFAVARSYRAPRRTILRRVVLPGSLPAVLAGLRLAFNTAVIVTVAVELVTGGNGIGHRVWAAWQNLRSDQLFATLFVITVIGYTANSLIAWLGRRLAPWSAHR